MRKIVVKSCESTFKLSSSKYANINCDNYYKFSKLNDLVGFRILTRFPQEWLKIDEYLRGGDAVKGIILDDPEALYDERWLEKCKTEHSHKLYLVEKPKYYYVNNIKQSPTGRFAFSLVDDLKNVDSDKFEMIPSDKGYRSIHYVFHVTEEISAELQVRTLLDEAWNEVEHDSVYKPNRNWNDSDNSKTRNQVLVNHAAVLANLIGTASTIGNNMYDVANNQCDLSHTNDDLITILESMVATIGDYSGRLRSYDCPSSEQNIGIFNSTTYTQAEYIRTEEGCDCNNISRDLRDVYSLI